MSYPDIGTYQALYAKYLKRPVTELTSLYDGDLKGKVVWDLCSGNGEIALACVDAGAAKVVAVDSSWGMLSNLVNKDLNGRLDVYSSPVEHYLAKKKESGRDWADVVFCRQAVNYWLDEHAARKLAGVMKPGSQFIFNTFNAKPSEKPTVKDYEYNGHFFVEVSWLVGDMVYHTQARDGMESHSTQFKWISKDDFLRILGEWYAIYIVEDGHTSIYRCTRKT